MKNICECGKEAKHTFSESYLDYSHGNFKYYCTECLIKFYENKIKDLQKLVKKLKKDASLEENVK